MKDDSAGMMRLAVGGMLAMAAAVGIGRFIYTPILPPMAEALALSKGEAGLIASANFAGYLAGALAAAAPLWSARLRLWLLIALAVSGVTTGAMTWPDSMAAFLILRFIGGFASAFVLVFASALVLQRLAAARRGSLSSVHFAGVGVGITLSALLTWGVTAWTGDWRIMWLAGGIASLVALAAVVMLLPAEAGRDAGTDPVVDVLPVRPGEAVDRLVRIANPHEVIRSGRPVLHEADLQRREILRLVDHEQATVRRVDAEGERQHVRKVDGPDRRLQGLEGEHLCDDGRERVANVPLVGVDSREPAAQGVVALRHDVRVDVPSLAPQADRLGRQVRPGDSEPVERLLCSISARSASPSSSSASSPSMACRARGGRSAALSTAAILALSSSDSDRMRFAASWSARTPVTLDP